MLWYTFGWEWVPLKSQPWTCLLITRNMLPNKYLPTFLANNTFPSGQPDLSIFLVTVPWANPWFTIMDRSSLTAVCSFHFIFLCETLQGNIHTYRRQGVKQAKLFLCAGQDATARGFRPPTHVMNNELVVLGGSSRYICDCAQLPPPF